MEKQQASGKLNKHKKKRKSKSVQNPIDNTPVIASINTETTPSTTSFSSPLSATSPEVIVPASLSNPSKIYESSLSVSSDLSKSSPISMKPTLLNSSITDSSTKKEKKNKTPNPPKITSAASSIAPLGNLSRPAEIPEMPITFELSPLVRPTNVHPWSRKENSLNLAAEENQSNRLTENTSLRQLLVESKAIPDNLIEATTNTLRAVESSCQMSSCSTESGSKSKPVKVQKEKNLDEPKIKKIEDPLSEEQKAKLKAERKAAFEAQRSAQLAQKGENAESKASKSKAELKAERRKVQEAQRASKGVDKPTPNEPSSNPDAKKDFFPVAKTIIKNIIIQAKTPDFKKSSRKLRLFSHLPTHLWDENKPLSYNSIHHSVIKFGLQMAQGIIRGSNARCVATLAALKEVIKEYKTPPQKELSRDLDALIAKQIEFINACRPLSASIVNGVKRIKWECSQVASITSDVEAKETLLGVIDKFIEEDIILAMKAISSFAGTKISDNDVILTYACSSLIKLVLSDAFKDGKKFRVVVVDSRPALQGRAMLKYLVGCGIPCTYVWINAVSYVIKEVTKVFLGCHSLQANGYVMSQVGSCQVALVAHASNVPVLVCCETYKFCERSQTDSFVHNELGDPSDLVKTIPTKKSDLTNWKDYSSLNIVNLTYDLMPSHLVASVITELQMLPCTSVPVVLRVKHLTSHEL